VNLLLAVEACPPENPGCFHVPSLEELFEFPAIFGSGLFAFNRVALLYLLSAVVVIGLFVAAFRNAKVVPGKLQAIMESIVGFVREQIVIEVIGPAGLRFVPFLTALFLFVFVNNFYEIMPFVQLPSTGRMAVPAFLALTVWTLFVVVGLKSQGPAYFKNVAVPSGVPAFVLPLVIPIEIVSTFIVRPLTLAVRLFANMMAGHILLAIIFIAANAFLLDVHAGINPAEWNLNLKGLPIGIVAFAFGPAMVAFELMVGALQAYIFTILAAVYIGGSLHPDH
jgi:F-type H+-transporting ATPase subunit a